MRRMIALGGTGIRIAQAKTLSMPPSLTSSVAGLGVFTPVGSTWTAILHDLLGTRCFEVICICSASSKAAWVFDVGVDGGDKYTQSSILSDLRVTQRRDPESRNIQR